jgi:hypothetical protein
MFFNTAAVAFFAGLAAAYHQPVGEPTGNPIATPGLNEIVPAGEAFEITWNPTTTNTVSLVLLRGPSTNVQPLYAIVEGISNTGSFSWTPSTELEADVTHYGLQIIDDVNGQFQYSTQFGISNDVVSSSTEGYYTATVTASSEAYSVPTPTATVTASSVYPVSESTTCESSTTTLYIPPTGTGYPGNSTIVLPSKSMTVPSSLLTSATGTSTTTATPPPFTGAASHINAGLGMVFGVAGLAFML